MRARDLRKGIIDGIPICLGYLSVSFAFGIFAVSAGLSVLETLLVSALNLTSAGQFAAVPIMTGGGTLLEMALTQFTINLRYSIMSVSLSQKLDERVKTPEKALIAFSVTDEIFAVAVSKPDKRSKEYMFGLALTPYLGWTIGTLLGAVAGSLLPAVVTVALSVAIYGMFIAIILPEAKRDLSVLLCVVIAAALSCAFYFLPYLSLVPSGFRIIICACVAALVMALVRPVNPETEKSPEKTDDSYAEPVNSVGQKDGAP